MDTVKSQIRKDTIRTKVNYSFAEMPTFKRIVFASDTISFHLSDNRIVTIPLNWLPKLENAAKAIREDYIIRSHFVFWENIDEIVGVKNLLNGSIVPQ